LVLCVLFLLVVINTSASDCLERLVPEMIYYVSRETLNSTHSLDDDNVDDRNHDDDAVQAAHSVLWRFPQRTPGDQLVVGHSQA